MNVSRGHFTHLPVRPQIPTFSPGWILNETSRRAGELGLSEVSK
jgi:hypothetical protein